LLALGLRALRQAPLQGAPDDADAQAPPLTPSDG